jgi:hypothetical protein
MTLQKYPHMQMHLEFRRMEFFWGEGILSLRLEVVRPVLIMFHGFWYS